MTSRNTITLEVDQRPVHRREQTGDQRETGGKELPAEHVYERTGSRPEDVLNKNGNGHARTADLVEKRKQIRVEWRSKENFVTPEVAR